MSTIASMSTVASIGIAGITFYPISTMAPRCPLSAKIGNVNILSLPTRREGILAIRELASLSTSS